MNDENYNYFRFSDCVVTSPAPNALNDDFAKKLWSASIDLVGLADYNAFTATDPGVNSK